MRLSVCSRLCYGCSMTASYGINKFLVKFPALLEAQYPNHVRNVTLYGRMLNTEYILNLNAELWFNEQVCFPPFLV